MKILIAVVIVVVLVLVVASCCRKKEIAIAAGGVYSVNRGEGEFGVTKVLVLADGVAHIRIYKNKFAERPTEIDLAELTLGGVDDPDGFGIGHLPIQEAEFRSWEPQLLAQTAVMEEELEGFNMWKEGGGGVWGQ